ncbi:Pc14g02300 [Penicillium rubens Wisconsin 54-1255]|uniref:Pc14g02300 protein n=2 Tax=Penicillium chrysogenum species complex TaxID=254878 RepID=B6H655_PENRW|nr:Pc14g02300 [Penicillium rubens Wisconsin 54-1255]
MSVVTLSRVDNHCGAPHLAMSNQSRNGGPHHSKLANKLDPRVDSGSQNAPDAHLGYAHNYGKGGKGGLHNNGIANTLDPRVSSDQDSSHRENVAASNPFMPQAGKPAGIHNPGADKPEQRIESHPDNNRRGNIAGSTHFIPQAGKPTGNSSL